MRPMRVGLISYLNCLPLEMGLERTGGLAGVDLVEAPPERLHAGLVEGELDVALVSTARWADSSGSLARIPGYGICSEGPVMSVLLASYGRIALKQARTVALTTESRTSSVLARVLLERVVGASPEYSEVQPEVGEVLAAYDAALFIGDRALKVRKMPCTVVCDLGDMWTTYSGLPMVYAVWVVPAEATGLPAVGVEEWTHRLDRAVRWTADNPDTAVAEALRRGAPADADALRRYFVDCLGYRVGRREREGLESYVREGGFASAGDVPTAPVRDTAMSKKQGSGIGITDWRRSMEDRHTAMGPKVPANLGELRDRIDELDLALVRLLNDRARIVQEVGTIKEAAGLPSFDPAREEEILQRVTKESPGPLYDSEVREIFEMLLHRLRDIAVQRREFAGYGEGTGEST